MGRACRASDGFRGSGTSAPVEAHSKPPRLFSAPEMVHACGCQSSDREFLHETHLLWPKRPEVLVGDDGGSVKR